MATTDMAISANARSMRPRFRGIRRSSSASIPVRDSLSVHDPVGDADRRAGNRPCSRVELARVFYERLGGVYVRSQPITIGAVTLEEVSYGWRRLDDVRC